MDIFHQHFGQLLPELLRTSRRQWVVIDLTDRFVGTFPSEGAARAVAARLGGGFVEQILEGADKKPPARRVIRTRTEQAAEEEFDRLLWERFGGHRTVTGRKIEF